METLVEQRSNVRATLHWPVSVWLPEANRFFNGHSNNISKGGVLISVPLATPVRPGQSVELNFPRTTVLAEEKGQFSRIKSGRIIRVDRKNMIRDASLAVAVQFD